MKTSRVVGILTMVGLAVIAWAGPIETDYDHDVNFAQFKTYAWTKGTPADNQLMEDRLVADVNEQLQAKGLKEVESDPDLLVATHAATHDAKQLDSTGFGYGGWLGRWGGMGMSTTEVVNIPEGTLLVDLVHAGDNKLVWRGTISDVVIPSNPEKQTKKLASSIAKLFNDFPPTN